MDTLQILSVLKSDTATAPICGGVFASDRLPVPVKVPSALVVNFDPSDKPGSHWISIYIDSSGKGEYFDPLAMPIPEGPIQKFLRTNCRSVSRAAVPVQGSMSSACGPHCLFFLLLRSRGLSMNRIINLYSKDRVANDYMAVHFINKRFGLNAQVFDEQFFKDRLAYKASASKPKTTAIENGFH